VSSSGSASGSGSASASRLGDGDRFRLGRDFRVGLVERHRAHHRQRLGPDGSANAPDPTASAVVVVHRCRRHRRYGLFEHGRKLGSDGRPCDRRTLTAGDQLGQRRENERRGHDDDDLPRREVRDRDHDGDGDQEGDLERDPRQRRRKASTERLRRCDGVAARIRAPAGDANQAQVARSSDACRLKASTASAAQRRIESGEVAVKASTHPRRLPARIPRRAKIPDGGQGAGARRDAAATASPRSSPQYAELYVFGSGSKR
jgi:hypothetical protein